MRRLLPGHGGGAIQSPTYSSAVPLNGVLKSLNGPSTLEESLGRTVRAAAGGALETRRHVLPSCQLMLRAFGRPTTVPSSAEGPPLGWKSTRNSDEVALRKRPLTVQKLSPSSLPTMVTKELLFVPTASLTKRTPAHEQNV
eukprot:scaffold25817_cov65-Phaeocystis_antarctica.AAC.5